MAEPTIFKVELLEDTAYNSIGDILDIKSEDNAGRIYYYDACGRWCYLLKFDNWKKLDWTPKKKKENEPVLYGNLRKDNDGHWYLIPIELISDWEIMQREELDDFYCHTGEEIEELYEKEMMKFEKYRLSGGVYDLKVLIEERV